MSTDRETTRLVRSWLEQGVTALPDRVLDAVLDHVPATPQRRSWWPARRSQGMSNYAKLAAAAAAVLVVAVVGYQLLGRAPNVGPPTATPMSTPPPAPTEVSRIPANGPIDAGTYRLGSEPAVLITVPSGWVSTGMGVRKHLDQPGEVAIDLFANDIRVFADACESKGTDRVVGPTTADLLTALQAQKNSEISDPVDVTIADLPGIRFAISAPSSLDITSCSIRSLQIWVATGGYLAGVGQGDPPVVATAYVADTPEGRLVFAPHDQGATAADLAEQEAIIASIEITQ